MNPLVETLGLADPRDLPWLRHHLALAGHEVTDTWIEWARR